MKYFLAVTILTIGNLASAENLQLIRQKISDSNYLPAPLFSEIDSNSNFSLQEVINPLTEVEIVVDKIINIGKKIWGVVEKGAPVVNQEYNSASALPEGASSWSQLSEWKMPRSAVYRIVYKNPYGASVVDFKYRLSFVYGGGVNGRGKYLTGVRVQPANLSVLWGYSFDVKAEVPEVFNMGTSGNPIAAANVIVKWKVSTALKNITESDQYVVNGLGVLKTL